MTAFRDACILSKQRFSDDPNLLPLWQLAKWHWWKVIASTIAFGVRALAIPPLVTADLGKMAAAHDVLSLTQGYCHARGGAGEVAGAKPRPWISRSMA